MGPINAIQTVFLKYASFSGRARRSEYWWFMLFYLAVLAAAIAADAQKVWANGQADIAFNSSIAGYWTPWVTLIAIIPYHAVSVRRLHDIGLSGWWMLGLVYGPGISAPFVVMGVVARAASGDPSAANLILAHQVVTGLAAISFLGMMVWPSMRDDNKYGRGVFVHKAVGGANFMANGNAANAGANATPKPKATHNPWNAYLSLERAEQMKTPEMQDLRKQEVQSLYRQKILGQTADPAP